MINVYIGLGSNLATPIEQIKQAHHAIAAQPQITEIAFSSLYASPPMGPQDQPDYVNAVMRIETDLAALDLLRVLQQIENQFGRVRTGERWGARTLDLDVLLYGNEQINHPDLIVPHIGIAERAFVLYPLQEIAEANLQIAGKGTLSSLVANCPLNDLEKIS